MATAEPTQDTTVRVSKDLLNIAGVQYAKTIGKIVTNKQVAEQALEFFAKNYTVAEAKGK